MSIFGKVILDELTRNHPERLAYYQHTNACAWYKPCSCALDQFARRNLHKPATKPVTASQNTIRSLFVVSALSTALYSAAFFYRWSVK